MVMVLNVKRKRGIIIKQPWPLVWTTWDSRKLNFTKKSYKHNQIRKFLHKKPIMSRQVTNLIAAKFDTVKHIKFVHFACVGILKGCLVPRRIQKYLNILFKALPMVGLLFVQTISHKCSVFVLWTIYALLQYIFIHIYYSISYTTYNGSSVCGCILATYFWTHIINSFFV